MSIACRLEAMDESGAGDCSTAAKLPEKVKGEDVKKVRVVLATFPPITVRVRMEDLMGISMGLPPGIPRI
ncbi:hypothetical protein YC2023_075931 [Brassica napus]